MGTFIAQQLQGKGRIVEISGLEGPRYAAAKGTAGIGAVYAVRGR